MNFILVLFINLLVGCAISDASAQELPQLHRGLNVAAWLANAPRQPMYARDFAQIKNAGFDHIRLPFNPEYYGFSLSQDGAGAAHIDFIALDRAIALAEQCNLPVILDIHADGSFNETLERHAWAEKKFVDMWLAIALHYQSHSSRSLIFELLNEPQYYKTEPLWNKLSARLVSAIHAVSPERVIVIGAPHGSDIEALSTLQIVDQPYVIYAFHFYEPYWITHQGIHMGFETKMIRYFRNLPYPSDLATKTVQDYAPNAPNMKQAQAELQAYIDTPWNADHMASRIRVAQQWASDHNVKILCGEYGVLRNHIDPVSRYKWIGDVRSAMDKSNIGWELWDYADLFGITKPMGETSTDPVDGSVRLVHPETGSRVFEPEALKALGLGGASSK